MNGKPHEYHHQQSLKGLVSLIFSIIGFFIFLMIYIGIDYGAGSEFPGTLIVLYSILIVFIFCTISIITSLIELFTNNRLTIYAMIGFILGSIPLLTIISLSFWE